MVRKEIEVKGSKMAVRLPEWLRREIKAIVVESLHEWEKEVEYLGREGYEWKDNKWVKLEKEE